MTNNLSKLQKFGRFAKPISIIILLSLTILSIYLTPKLLAIKTQYSLDQFQPTTSHILREDDNIKDTFKTHGQLPIIADLKIKKNGHWLSPNRLKTLAFISKEIKRIDGVEKTTSLTTVDTAIPDQGSFYVGSILDLSMNNQERQQVLQNPFLVPHLLSKDGKNVSLLIELKRLSFDQQQITIKKIQETLKKQATFFDANIGGPAAITATMTDMVSKEVITSTLASLLISILFFFVLFKNPSVLMASALIVLYSNIIGLGMLWLFDLKLTVLTSTLPSIITLTVVAIAVQTFSRVALFRHKVIEKHKHIMTIKIISGVIGSSFLASVTTAIGFATLITSDTPIMREYGLSVSIAVIVSSITCLLLLSALLVWMPVPHKRKLSFPVHKFFSYFFVYQKPFLATIAALCVCFLFLGSNLNWSARLFDDLPQEAKAIQATKAMESTFGGVLPMDVMITAPTVDYWKQHYNILRLDQLKREFSKKEGIGSIVTLSDFFKLSSMNGRLPASHSALSENYFVYAMAQDNPLDQFVTLDYKSTRLSLKLHDIPADQNDALVSAFVERAKTMFPDTTVTKGGIAATVHTLNKSLSLELILGAFAALLAIFILLVIIFRSVRWSLVAMIPNLMAPLALLGALGLTNTPIKPSLAIVFAISLGISFDNTIYVLMKLRKLVAQKGNTVRLPILGLMREELVPCLVSSSAIITGFSVFLFSNFSINKTFGIFMILSLTAGLIGDLVLLPVLLHYAPGLLLKPINIAKLQERLGAWTMKPTTQRYIIVFAIFTACAMLSQPAFAAKTANGTELLKQIAYKNATPSEEAKIRMKIQESDGSSKERILIIKKKVKKDQMALVRLLSPNDLKGVGLLTVNKDNNENQWLYLPSEKRSRRIVGSNRNGRFLDSEISYEDMRISTYENFHNKVTEDPKGNQDIVLIESTVKNKKDSSYGKIKTWVDTKKERLLKTEYYTPEGELLKVMTFANYKKYDKVWRAQSVQVKNVKKNRSTVLEIEKFSTKNISDDEFSIDTLEEG